MKTESYELERQEDAERWEEYQRTGQWVSQEVVREWLEKLAKGEAPPLPKPVRPQPSNPK